MNVIVHQDKMQRKKYQQQLIKTRIKNGFSNAPTPWQITSSLLYILIQVHFFLMVSFISQKIKQIIYSSVQACLFGFVFFIWIRVITIDPSDSIHVQHSRSILQQKEIKNLQWKYKCPLCRTYRSRHSFHCKKCNKCVELFDHHCKWINNCIGAKNYIQFIVMLGLVSVNLLYNAIIIIYSIVVQLEEKSVIRVISVISCVIQLLIFLIIFGLLVFHIVLIINQKTTLSLILQARNKLKEEVEQNASTQKLYVILKPIGLYVPEQVERDKNIYEIMEQKKKEKKMKMKMKMKKSKTEGQAQEVIYQSQQNKSN